MDRPYGVPARWRVLAMLLMAVIVSGCRVDVTAEIEIERDGSGVVQLTAALDEELLAELDELGVDPTAELAATSVHGWRVSRVSEGKQGVTVGLRRELDDARDAGPALRELTASLTDADPAVVVDVEVNVTDDAGATVDGTAELRAPADVGVAIDGDPLGPSPQRLAEITADVVDARFVVRTPGDVVSHNGTPMGDRAVVWPLEVGAPVPVAVSAAPSALRVSPWLVGAAVTSLPIIVGAIAWRRRRRISRAA